MSSGIQSRTALTSATWTNIYSGPSAGRASVITVNFTNRSSSTGTIYLALSTSSSSPGNSEYLLYAVNVNPYSPYEIKNIVVGYGYYLLAYASGTFSVQAYGIDDVTDNYTVTGRFGAADLAATTNTSIASGPASGRMQTATVQITNRNNSIVTVNLAITSSPTSPSASDYIEYNVALPAYGTLTRTGIVLANGQGIGVYSSAAGVNAVCWGIDNLA